MKRKITILLLLALCCFSNAQVKVKGHSTVRGKVSLQVLSTVTMLSINVTPVNQEILVGTSVGYNATGVLSNGQNVNLTNVVNGTWGSSNPAIALTGSLTSVKTFVCVSVGTAQIQFAYGGLVGMTSLTCDPTPPPPPVLQSVSVSPSAASIAVGTSQPFTATGHYSDDSSQDLTATPTAWSTSDSTIASVGTLTAQQNYDCKKGGTATVTATAGGFSGTASLTCNAVLVSITVAPATGNILIGAQQTFTATCNYNDGSSQSCTLGAASWTSSDNSVATAAAPVVNPEPYTGIAAGTVTVTKTIGTITGTASLTVTNPGPPPPTLTSVTVAPTNKTVNVGSTLNYTAICVYSDGSTQDCTATAVWLSTVTSVATITTSGNPRVATCVTAGGTAIQATVSGHTGTTPLTCQTPTPTLVSIAITPANQTINVPSGIGMIATCTYSDTTTKDCTLQATWSSGNTNIVTMASPVADPEQATCTAAGGPITISAQIGATTATTGLTCQAPVAPSFGNDAYCNTGNVWTGGASDSYALLPNTCYYTNPSVIKPNPGGTTRTATVATLVTVWNASACGDTITLAAGSTGTGNITLPTKTCTGPFYTTIETSGFASLPPYGTKITPCYAGVASLVGRPDFQCTGTTNVMATIQSTGTGTALKLSTNTSFLLIKGLVLTRSVGTGEVVRLFDPSASGVNHIVLEQVWLRGTPTDEIPEATNFNRANYIALLDFFSSNIQCISVSGACTDSTVVGGGTNNNSGDTDNTWKVVNGYVEAGQNIFFGGGAGVLTPTSIELRNLWLYKPYTWNPACTVLLCGIAYDGGVGGHPFSIKNCIEFKNADRVLIEGVQCENGWGGFSQVGNAFTLTPKSQAQGTSNLCPLCKVTNITIRYSVVKTYWQLFQVVNTSNANGAYAAGGNHYSIHDVLGDHMQYAACFQCPSSASQTTLNNTPNAPTNSILNNVDINHITNVLAGDRIGGFSSYIVGVGAAVSPNQNFNIKWQNNIWSRGVFGAIGSSYGNTGCAAGASDSTGYMNNCWNNKTVTGNAPLKSLQGTGGNPSWPSGTCTTGVDQTTIYMAWNGGIGGDYHVKPSSPCKNTANDGKDPGVDIDNLNNHMKGVAQFAPVDMVRTISIGYPQRTTQHMGGGTGNPHFSWMDADGLKDWQEKASTGHPWDINVYGAASGCVNNALGQAQICHYITEDGDPADQAQCIADGYTSCFVDPFAYKKQLNAPLPIMARFYTGPASVTSTGSNTFARTTHCEAGGRTTNVNLGPTYNYVRGPALMQWGGSVGTADTYVNDFYYTKSGATYLNREQFYYVYPYGLVQWQNENWTGTNYNVNQTTNATTVVTGGAAAPAFPCYGTTPNWIGGAPGAGGNAPTP